MNQERWADVQRIYHAALERPAAERANFLDQACGSDVALKDEVQSLLAYQTEASPFLERPALEHLARALRGNAADQPFPTVAGYRILEILGEGGMGIVYLAEQPAPIRRRVALKLVRLGMDSREVLARFDAERQALALMDHPNIASVFDAGTTEGGRPYFVMEYVPGPSITEYCDSHRLSIRARIELFTLVCGAVQHAHQKGVIHRDLKPSNVLVVEQHGRAVPKVIDFGIAKATEQRLTEQTIFTEQGLLIGTPEYMSPEQANSPAGQVDARSDIYSLGVVLYELLVGSPPFPGTELRRAGYAETLRIIRDQEPRRPSAVLDRLDAATTTVVAQRQTNTSSLARELRDDLDWIALKALEKDPTRRYGSASELADDLERQLNHEPVMAGPPRVGYRLRKFTRKHRGAVTAVAALLVLFTGGITASTLLYFRAERATAEADLQRASVSVERDAAARARQEADQRREEAQNAKLAAADLRQQAWTDAQTIGKQQLDAEQLRWFNSETALTLRLTANFAAVDPDSYGPRTVKATLDFRDDDGPERSVPITIRADDFREHAISGRCGLAPLRLELPNDQVNGTVFAGEGVLKLDTQCRVDGGLVDQYVLREYSAYRIYNLLTPWSFRARLAKVIYLDVGTKKSLSTQYAILIEDDHDVAQRMDGRMIVPTGTQRLETIRRLDQDTFTMMMLFEYLIGNINISFFIQHNVQLVQMPAGMVHPVPYGFQWTGLVDRPDWPPATALNLKTVRDRLYRGPCRPAAEFESFFVKFRSIKPQVRALYDSLPDFNADERKKALSYLDEFYRMIDHPDEVKAFVANCVPNPYI